MAFPSSPTNGQTYSANGVTYVYDSGMGVWDPQGTVAGSSPVASVAGRTGTVTLTAADIGSGTFPSGALTTGGVLISTGNIVAGSGTTSTNTTTGALIVTGGLGVSGAVNIGGAITASSFTASSATVNGTLTATSLSISAINNIPVGSSTASTGAFTTLAASGAVSFSSTASITGRITKSVSGGLNSPSARFALSTSQQLDMHISSSVGGSSPTNTQQYGISFTNGGGSTQAGIVCSENGSDGTSIGFFCTDSYAAGPKLQGYILPAGHTYFSGGLGIGTSPPGTSGQILATNSITAFYSDGRLKTRVGKIENALDKIDELAAFLYKHNNIARGYGYTDDLVYVGLDAQIVHRVQPEATALAPFDRGEDGLSKSGENYLTVQYEKLVPLLVEGIKELRQEINRLKGK